MAAEVTRGLNRISWVREDGETLERFVMVDAIDGGLVYRFCDAAGQVYPGSTALSVSMAINSGAEFQAVGSDEPVGRQMNRQARSVGEDKWSDCGPVTFESAAIWFAELRSLQVTSWVEVRDEAEPEVIRCLRVMPTRGYRVAGLRGDADRLEKSA
jgi:hypothetical protein